MAILDRPLIYTEKSSSTGFKDNILEELIKRFQINIKNHKYNNPYETVIKSRLLSAIKENLTNLKIYYERDENGRNQFG